MIIAIDAMGGDHAPRVTVEGAVQAKRELGLDIVLVGHEESVAVELKKYGAIGEIPIEHASEEVLMDEPPMKAVRSKPDSSIRVAASMVRDDRAQAFISAGNSGAVMACGVLILGRVPGIERPALASVFPSLRKPTVVLDVGANLDSRPRHLLQFGLMGNVFARLGLDYQNPRVGLLSVGEEDAKGNDQTKRAHDLFRNSSLNFVGNVEGRDIFAGVAEVIVCDGFVGNVCLKLAEGTATAMATMLRREIAADARSKLGGLLLKPAFERFAKTLRYSEYGGAPLLGVKGACLVCHGASNAHAIKNAARVASEWVSKDYYKDLAEAVEVHSQKLDQSASE